MEMQQGTDSEGGRSSNLLEIDGGSSSKLGDGQIDVNVNQSSGLVASLFVAPLPLKPIITGISGISEDENLHKEDCPYRCWKRIYYGQTTDDVVNCLYEFEIRTKGKKKTAGQEDQIRKKAMEKATRPVIQDYLEGSRATYDTFKVPMLKKCKCAQARLGMAQKKVHQVQMPKPIIFNANDGASEKSENVGGTSNVPLEQEGELEELGLDLSESDED